VAVIIIIVLSFSIKLFTKYTAEGDYLSSIKMTTLLGNIYSEFKPKFRYFEVVRLIVRMMVILVMSAVDDTFYVVATIITLILMSYLAVSTYLKPYFYYKTQAYDTL
jgi:hypothetical protein